MVDTLEGFPVAKTMAYAAIAMRPEHEEDVLRLWRESFYDPRVAAVVGDRYRWLYDQNPSGAALTWLGIRTDTGEVLGCGSLYPRQVRVNGEMRGAGVLSDFAVAKAHRVAGCALTIQRAIMEHRGKGGYDFFFGYPNKASIPIVKRVGYEVLGQAESFTKPLQTGEKLASQVRNPHLARAMKNPWVAAAAGLLVDLGLGALDFARMITKLSSYEVEVLLRADDRHDALWSRCTWDRVSGEKSAAYLNWRYAGHTTEHFQFFCLVERATGRLAGCVTYAIAHNKAFIVDLVTERVDESIDLLLLHFAMKMREERRTAIHIAYFGDPAFGERLHKLQFFRRPAEGRFVILWTGNGLAQNVVETVRNSKNWLMFDGDLDI